MTIDGPTTMPLPSLVWQRRVLPNGLTLVVHEDRREPRIHVGMNYRVGSKDETAGVDTGFAHLFEHLMFGGTQRLPGPYVDRLKDAGALDVNAVTSHDSTCFYQLIHTGMLEFVLFAEADRMAFAGPQLRQDVLDQQREIVLMEKRQREGEPLGLLPRYVSRGLFPVGHPYRHTVIGEEADLRAATLERARAWSARYYTPDNAVLILVGDVDAEQALAMVERQFGHLPPGPPLFRPGRWTETSAARRRDVLEEPLVNDPLLHFCWIGADARDPRSDMVAFAVGLLNDGRPSALARALVHEGGPVREVSAHEVNEWVCGQVSVTLRLAPNANVDTVERDFRAVLAELLDTTFDATRFDRLRDLQVRALNEACASLRGKAELLTSGELTFEDPGAFARVAKLWMQSTVDDVRDEALRCLGAEPYVLHVVPNRHEDIVTTAIAPTDIPPVTITHGVTRPLRAECTVVGPGVTMWHAPGPSSERLALRLVSQRGMLDLTPAERPLALLLTAIAGLGLAGRKADAQAAWLATAGLTLAIRCDAGSVQVSIEGPAASAPAAIDLLSNIVSWSAADATDQAAGFEFELQQALRRWITASTDPIGFAAALPLRALLGPDNALQLPPASTVRSLTGVTLSDARALHRKLFDPRLSTLIAVGGDTAAAWASLIDRAWAMGVAPQQAGLARAMPSQAPSMLLGPAPVSLVEAGHAGQALLVGACLLPPFDPHEGWALQALVHILGGGAQSRLSRRLRDELNITYGTHVSIDNAGRTDIPRVLTIRTALDPAQAAAGLREVQLTLAALGGHEPASVEEVEAFKRNTALLMPTFAREPAEVCEALAFQCRMDVRSGYWSERAQALQGLSPIEVHAMAQALLQAERFRWSFAGDVRSLSEQLTAHGFDTRLHVVDGWTSVKASDDFTMATAADAP